MHPPNGAACITHRKSSATTIDPIRSLFVYYVWFTVVYQGKSGSARERARRVCVFSLPPGTYDQWLSMTYRWKDPQRERKGGWHTRTLGPRCRYRAFRGKITALYCTHSRDEMNCHRVGRYFSQPPERRYCRLLRRRPDRQSASRCDLRYVRYARWK